MAWLVESPAGDSGASKLRAPRAVIMAPVSLSSARRYTHQYRSVIGCWLITCVGLGGLIGFVFVPHSVRCHSAWLADRLSGSGILIDSHRFFSAFFFGWGGEFVANGDTTRYYFPPPPLSVAISFMSSARGLEPTLPQLDAAQFFPPPGLFHFSLDGNHWIEI